MAAFSSLTDRLSNAFKHLKSKGKLSDADIDGTIREIRRALLDADVSLDVVRSFTARVRDRALSTEVSEALNPAQQVVRIVNDELTDILGQGVDRPLNFAKNPPTIIMLAGLQGAGKTTLAGKLGYWLKDSGHTPLLVAADLQRPNAVTQLEVVGERAGVPVYAPEKGVQSAGGDAVSAPGETTGDPVKVARDSIEYARQKMYDTVIIDTAGRLGVDETLMQQARDIRDAVQPNEVLFVIDAMTGQDAVRTAQAFDEGVNFTGVVLSKLDGDTRGGAALSVASVTGKPILFASNGEGLKDFEVFHPDRMASRILDMGDILTLIEQAQREFDEEETRKAAAKMAEGEFGLDDFLAQLQQALALAPTTAQPFVDESITYVDIAGDHAKGADVLTRGLAVAVMPGDVNFMYYRLAYSLWQTNNREAALACYAFMLGMGFHAQYEEAAEVEVRELMQEMGVDSLPDMDAVTHTLNKHGIPVAPLTSQTELLAKAAIRLVDAGFPLAADEAVWALGALSNDDRLGALRQSLRFGVLDEDAVLASERPAN